MYHLIDYVGLPDHINRLIQIATEKSETIQGQAAKNMLDKRHFKNFKNKLNIIKN